MEKQEDRLRELGKRIDEERQMADSESRRGAELEQRNQDLYDRAFAELQEIRTRLVERIVELVPVASVNRDRTAVELGAGTLTIPNATRTTSEFGGQKYDPPFGVIAYSSVSVTIPRDRYGFGGKAHSIWFADAQEEGDFNWFETAFMIMPLIARTSVLRPYDLPPDEEAAQAISPVMGTTQLAWPFVKMDGDGQKKFIDYWMGVFADAAEGKLQLPNRMPERDAKGTWRT